MSLHHLNGRLARLELVYGHTEPGMYAHMTLEELADTLEAWPESTPIVPALRSRLDDLCSMDLRWLCLRLGIPYKLPHEDGFERDELYEE